jgi:hypothetical protein
MCVIIISYLTFLFQIQVVSLVFLEQLEQVNKAREAEEHAKFPQPQNLKWYLSGLVGKNLRHCQNWTPPNHIDLAGSELLHE